MKKLFLLITVGILTICSVRAQQKNYDAVDKKVAEMGDFADKNVAEIATLITKPFADNEQKARAIFYWIANNIALDPKATKNAITKNTLPEEVIKLRTGNPLGIATLYQEMASQAKIRCLVVDGFIKRFYTEINEPVEDVNSSWNVVQLGASPETWYYVDAASAIGSFDEKFSLYTRFFTSELFFADKKLFNLSHLPDNTAWLLDAGTKSKKEFYALPIYSNGAFKYNLGKALPAQGLLKIKLNKEQTFQIPSSKTESIDSVVLETGKGKKLQRVKLEEFSKDNNQVAFKYKFAKEDVFPLRIYFNDDEVMVYNCEVEE